MKRKVLFVCATNGVQSPMAEALLNRIAPEHFDATSAGLEPDFVRPHPLTIEVMEECGFDLRQTVCTKASVLRDQKFDFVITIGDRNRFRRLVVAGSEFVHWEFEDPTKFTDAEKQLRAFRMARDQIAQRLNLFVLVQVRPRMSAGSSIDSSSRPHQSTLKLQ